MSGLAVETFRQVYNANGFEGTSFDALATPDTQGFRNMADFTVFSDLNTLFALLVEGTNFGAFLGTLIGLALVRVDDGLAALDVHTDRTEETPVQTGLTGGA